MWGFVQLEDGWYVLKHVLDLLDKRKSESLPEGTHRCREDDEIESEHEHVAIGPIQGRNRYRNNGGNAVPEADT